MLTPPAWGKSALAHRRQVRLAVQALTSLAVVLVLLWVVRSGTVRDSLTLLRPQTLALAAGMQLAAFGLNGRRWQLLLGQAGVRERLGPLTELYFIGNFCSLFLPTGAGGDAVRVYEVAQRSGRPGRVLVGTLQERFLGLGASMFLGLVAAVYYLPLLPASMRWGVLLLEAGGSLAAVLLLFPGLLLQVVRRLWRPRWFGEGLARLPLVARTIERLQTLADVPFPALHFLLRVCVLTFASVLFCIASCYVLAHGLGVEVPFLGLCLVVPLVWVVRLLPVSLNGIGVGEGAFVFLLGLFAVPQGQALTFALVLLGLQTSIALIGGALLLLRAVRSRWRSADDSDRGATGPVAPDIVERPAA